MLSNEPSCLCLQISESENWTLTSWKCVYETWEVMKTGLLTRKGWIKMELQEGKFREIEGKRPLERWNKGEADGWKWRSNWIGRFVKMWWHKQSVHRYCTLLEVEGNILKLQAKKKRKKLPALCQEWSPQVFSLCSLADSLSSSSGSLVLALFLL